MAAMDSAERELFLAAVDQVVASGTIDAGLDQLGWDDALADDGRTAVAALFEAQGRAGATSGALDRVLAAALGTSGGVVLPSLGSTAPPGQIAAGQIVVRGLGLGSGIGSGPDALVVADDGTVLQVAGLDRRPVRGLDPALGLVEVTGTVPRGEGAPVGWADAVVAGQRALAHELVGASRAMLELARTHALERIQFDVPIASFQAVRHKLAEAFVAIESAEAVLDVAWEEPSPLTASMAKAVAGRSARLVAKHSQQVLAGIGFTLEHPFHRYLRRTRVLDHLLGDTRTLTKALGQHLLETRALPPLLPL
jgi:hypothetical protein